MIRTVRTIPPVEQTTKIGEAEQTEEAEQTTEDGRVAEATERL